VPPFAAPVTLGKLKLGCRTPISRPYSSHGSAYPSQSKWQWSSMWLSSSACVRPAAIHALRPAKHLSKCSFASASVVRAFLFLAVRPTSRRKISVMFFPFLLHCRPRVLGTLVFGYPPCRRVSTHRDCVGCSIEVSDWCAERLAPRHISGVEPPSLDPALNAGRGEPVQLWKEAYTGVINLGS
jgi:hypothetical protein